MKKIVLLLVITHVASLSCAEMERLRKQKEVPVSPQQMVPILQQTESYWQTLDNLVDSHYMPSQPMVFHSDAGPLMTVYKPSTKKEETKPLLRTNPSRPLSEIRQELRDKSYKFINTETVNKRLNQRQQKKELAHLINCMNQAKLSGIDEDMMARFIFNNKSLYHSKKLANDIDISGFTALFFNLLKRYSLTVQETKEQLPSYSHKSLKEVFSKSSQCSSTTNNIYAGLEDIRAFSDLTYVLRYMLQECDAQSIDIFTTCLYDDEKTLRRDHSDGSYKDLKNEFCNKAYDVMLYGINEQDIYNLLQIIDNAKNKKDIKRETGFGYSILKFNPTLSLAAHANDIFANETLSIKNLKNRIALFCKLAKSYNNNRGTKTTPTSNQYKSYFIKHNLGITLPDSFRGPSLFDDKQYAFAEFHQLIRNTRTLFNSNAAEVEEMVKKLYRHHLT